MAAASQDNSSLLTDQTIPQWKRELILRRRAQSRTLPAGNTTVKLTCPSVVTAVRQAESVPVVGLAGAAGENVSGYQQRCISSTIPSNKGSLDQAQADFHPGGRISSASSSVGENMRLVEHQAAPGSRMINGVGCDSNISIDQLNYRSKMGEEKSVKKSCASNNRKMDNNSVLKSVVVHRETNHCSHPNEEEPHSDSSEELQYGPGIVKRLKSKYMSMTLRENQNKGVRPSLSNMRRATSLENMLESDETGKPPLLIKPQHKFTKRTEATSTTNKSQYISQHQQRYRSVSRGNDSIKRARSVEALLRYDTKLQNIPIQQLSTVDKLLVKTFSRDEIVIIDKTEDKPPIPQPTATRNKKRAIMNASQKAGLPPPDVVKQTLKLFESTQVKSSTSVPKINGPTPPPLPLAKLNINIANQTKPVVGSNKPLLSPKPSPEKIRRSPLIKAVSPKRAPPPIPVNVPPPLPVAEAPQASAVPIVPSRVLPLDIPVQAPSPPSFPSPRLKSPSPTNNTAKTILTPSNGSITKPPTPPFVKPRTPSPVSKARTPSPLLVSKPRSPSPISRVRTPSPVSKPRVPSPTLQVAAVTNGNSSPREDEPMSSEEDAPDACVKTVTRSSLENIRKDSSTVQFSFSSNTSSDKSKSYLPGGKSHPTPPPVSKVLPKTSPPILGKRAQSPSLPPRNPIPMSPLPVLKSPDTPTTPTKQVGVIRPIVSTKVQSPSLTDREIEKNLINRVKSSPIEQPTKVVVSLKPSEIVVGNVSDSVKGRLGMDDSAMKEMVKCVKESSGAGLWDKKKPWNQQQNTMVFNFSGRKDPVPDYIENDGLILRSKREKIRPGDSGIILLDPSVEESSTDYDDDLSTGFTGPPSPCNVLFEGDNILINGRSNLRKQPKQRKLRITFNDNATTMFEYPSEASLFSDPAASGSIPSPGMSVAGGLPTPPPPSTGAPGLPTPIGGSSLASYTPSKVSMGSEDFQLGVTRTTPLPKPKEANATPTPAPGDEGQSEYLKPAEDADNVAWSADTNDDLLF